MIYRVEVVEFLLINNRYQALEPNPSRAALSVNTEDEGNADAFVSSLSDHARRVSSRCDDRFPLKRDPLLFESAEQVPIGLEELDLSTPVTDRRSYLTISHYLPTAQGMTRDTYTKLGATNNTGQEKRGKGNAGRRGGSEGPPRGGPGQLRWQNAQFARGKPSRPNQGHP